jgi:ribosomal protein S18 acetylase RimI-like enzyme
MPKLTIQHLPKEHLLEALKLVMRSANNLRIKHGRKPWVGTFTKVPLLNRHLYETDAEGHWGAYNGDKLIGFSSSVVRGGQWYLSYLFVDPRHQGKGLGRKLLERAMEHGGSKVDSRALSTFAYNETSVALYSSYGIMPAWPLLEMFKKNDKPEDIAWSGLKVEEDNSHKFILRINRLEKEIRGYPHLIDLEFLAQSPRRRILQFFDGAKWIGYSIVGKNGLLAPVGAISPEYLPQIVIDSYHHCRAAGSDVCLVWVGGPNTAVYQQMISLGFKLTELLLIMSTKPYGDFMRYCPADLSIF